GRRDGGRGSRAAPSPAVRPDEVRHVEPRVPIVGRRAGGALDAASGPALPDSGGAAVMHDDWLKQIEQELDGELSLPERAGRARPRSRRRVRCSGLSSARAALVAALPAPPASGQAPTYRVTYRLRVIERLALDTQLLATAVVSGPPETALRLLLRAETGELR